MANYKVGRLFSEDGKNFDIAVVMNWPTEEDYEKAEASELPGPSIAGFYFGDTDKDYTFDCINQFIDIQDKFNCLKHPILVEKIWGNPVMNWLDNNTYPLVDILKLCSNILNAKNTVEAHHILSIWEVEDALNNL